MSSPPFSLLIKPASADCNLQCEYCFYLEKSELYPDQRRHRMGDAVLDKLISTYMATDQPVYSFGWQGGEPTLMGIEFFRRVTDLQMKHGRKGAVVANGLQTNAILIDDEMASHFAQYKFLLGVSLDGLEDMHDAYRRTAGGGPSHKRVLARTELLTRNGVEFNILATVHAKNVGRPAELYRYLVDSGFLFHQYIPIVEFDPSGAPLPFTITGRQWGEFLCGVFDEWMKADVTRVSIRDFDAILAFLVDGNRQICTMGDNCCQYFLVEHNGMSTPATSSRDPTCGSETSWKTDGKSFSIRRCIDRSARGRECSRRAAGSASSSISAKATARSRGSTAGRIPHSLPGSVKAGRCSTRIRWQGSRGWGGRFSGSGRGSSGRPRTRRADGRPLMTVVPGALAGACGANSRGARGANPGGSKGPGEEAA